jgi:hypothetical protein
MVPSSFSLPSFQPGKGGIFLHRAGTAQIIKIVYFGNIQYLCGLGTTPLGTELTCVYLHLCGLGTTPLGTELTCVYLHLFGLGTTPLGTELTCVYL